ncbi:MAG: UvrD-helicase domain-containing protein [Clostridia bacterium]|nr:UvrD-helicase domain-containing protein [Clostridia bacterium]
MAKISYTPAQRTAVYWRGGNLLLSAAAGSGKTAALTGRICSLIGSGEAELNEMLIVTFTKAAASEMRQRISSSLAKSAAEMRSSSPEVAAMISRAIAKVPSAEISTIHSFLYRTLGPYFPVLGLPQDSHIADTKVIDSLKSEVMRDVVDEFFASEGEALERFTALADIIGQVRDTSAIDEELLWLANRLTSNGEDHRALQRYADVLESVAESGDITGSAYGKLLRDELVSFFAHYSKIFADFADEFETLPKVNEKYGPALATCADWVNIGAAMLADGFDYESMRAHFAAFSVGELGKLSGKDACETSAAFKFFRDEIKVNAPKMAETYFAADVDEAVHSFGECAKVLRLTAEVLSVYFEKFTQKKREMSAIDYNDLETLALSLLIDENGEPTAAAEEIGRKYKYIFIDEYQDTNSVQERIFRAVSKNARRFMVGDIKQSIYRFRGADPSVFSGYRRAWETVAPAPEGEDYSSIPFEWEGGSALFMSENFRCDSPVVRFVNMVSGYILPHGGIPYGGEDALVYAKNGGIPGETSPASEICLIEKKRAKKGEAKNTPDINFEAEYVARRIAGMIGKYSPSGEKLIKAGDIAILLRSPSTSGADYRDALAKYGIPSALKVERPLSSYPSVMLLMCILNFIDNPLRDIYVTGALRSPVFGFTMSELVEIKKEGVPLYLSVVERSQSNDSPTHEKCASATARLEMLKTVARGMRADKYLEYLIDEINLYSIHGIRENGAERDAVNRLCALASDFASGVGGVTKSSDISAFLEYATEAIDSPDAGSGNSGGEDAVSIMSIHASKGLEFPICFVSECAKKRNTADETRTVLYDEELGLGMYLPDESRLLKCDTLLRKIIATKLRHDSVEEEMRMLYVALTRAREHLIVTSKTENAEGDLADARLQAEFADRYHIAKTNSYIDWILESAANGQRDFVKINVTYATDLTREDETVEMFATDEIPWENEAETVDFAARFAYAYPHEYLSRVPSKLTVSKLRPEILDGEDDGVALTIDAPETVTEKREERQIRPSFMQSEDFARATAAERGTATHVFMQFVRFDLLKEHGVRHEIERLVSERFITRETAALIHEKQMERFCGSVLLDKLLRSPMVKREFRFNALLNGERFTADEALAASLRENGVKLTVQGVVDCVFRDPDTGKLILVDYKTDYLTTEEMNDRRLAEHKLRERHKNQLTYYREICSDMFSEEIEESYVYSTVLGSLVKM